MFVLSECCLFFLVNCLNSFYYQPSKFFSLTIYISLLSNTWIIFINNCSVHSVYKIANDYTVNAQTISYSPVMSSKHIFDFCFYFGVQRTYTKQPKSIKSTIVIRSFITLLSILTYGIVHGININWCVRAKIISLIIFF